jgi:CheY-like chemotaxis protein
VTKVLYVEDNDDNVFMLKMRLELLGDFEVLTAEDGKKGCTCGRPSCAICNGRRLNWPPAGYTSAGRRTARRVCVHPMQGDEIRALRRLQREEGASSHV